jgi:hypothetical protein
VETAAGWFVPVDSGSRRRQAVFRRSPSTPTWRRRLLRRLAAAVVGLAAAVAVGGVAASPAHADIAPRDTVWYEGVIRSWAQGRCLDSNHAGEVYSIPCNFGNYQKWRVRIWQWPDNQFPTVRLQNVATQRYLVADVSIFQNTGNVTSVRTELADSYAYVNRSAVWRLVPAYAGRWDAWILSLVSGQDCLDANQPFDTTGKRPYVRKQCGSNYQDWKMGY